MIHALALLILSQEPRLTDVVFGSRPMGALITIDGKPTGRKTPVPLSQAFKLAPGKHTVVFTLDETSSAPQEFEVTDRTLVVKGEVPAKVAPTP